jgi:hypothetical protein
VAVWVFLSFVPFQILKSSGPHSREIISKRCSGAPTLGFRMTYSKCDLIGHDSCPKIALQRCSVFRQTGSVKAEINCTLQSNFS